jgi:2-oxoglutarate dehydrogenase E1 component
VDGHFAEAIDDSAVKPERVRRVLICSGKVYYDLIEKRSERRIEDVVIIRLEQFYPFPEAALRQFLGRYATAREWVWVQEESQNMGGWAFVEPRFRAMGYSIDYVGRDASSSPATGSLKVHKREQVELVEAALAAAVPHVVGASRNGVSTAREIKHQPV